VLRRRADTFNAPSLCRAEIKKLAVMPIAEFLARQLLWLPHIKVGGTEFQLESLF
jgi:hypothetical protein